MLLALGRRGRRRPAHVARVGILSCTTIGDAILASAIARDICRAWPHCHITAFIGPGCRGLSELMLGYDAEVPLSVTKLSAALRVLRDHPVDVLIDPAQWPRATALLSAFASASFTIGFRTAGAHRHFAYDSAVPHSPHRHELENFQALLQPLGIPGTYPPLAQVRAQRSAEGPCIVLHPWASGYRSQLREWDMANWVAVAQQALACGATIVITGGPDDCARAAGLAAAIGEPERVLVLAGSATLSQTAATLAGAAAVITVNTGTMHLAAALNCPMIALHGPTNPRRWGPISRNAVVLGPGPEQGGAYLNLGFEYPRSPPDCMAMISPEDVLASLGRMLQWDRPRRRQAAA